MDERDLRRLLAVAAGHVAPPAALTERTLRHVFMRAATLLVVVTGLILGLLVPTTILALKASKVTVQPISSPSLRTGVNPALPQMSSGSVLFRTYANNQAGLAEAMTSDGSVVEHPAAQPATGIAVSPRGDEVAFNETIDVTQSALAVLDLSSGEIRRIVSDLGGLNGPAWSAIRDEILFATGTGDIYTVRPDGSNLTVLKEAAGAVEVGWSPDGKEIAYSTHEGDVWVLTLSDLSTRQVWHRSLGFGSWPSWSPTEAVLAIQAVDPESQLREVHLVPTSENSSLKPVTLNVGRDVFEPSWTPDGEFLLVSAGTPDAKDRDIYAIRLADSSIQLVVGTPQEDSVPKFISE